MGYLQIQKDNMNHNIQSISFFSQIKNAANGKTVIEAQLSGWRALRMVVMIRIADDQIWQMVMRNARMIPNYTEWPWFGQKIDFKLRLWCLVAFSWRQVR